MTAHANTKILVRIGQFKAATHGEASLQASQPSAHGKHSNVFALLYNEISPYFVVKWNYYFVFPRCWNFREVLLSLDIGYRDDIFPKRSKVSRLK